MRTEDSLLTELEQGFVALRLSAYFELVILTLVVYEYLITFDREVRCAWGRKLSWGKAVFLFIRYTGFIYAFAPFTYTFLPKSDSRQVCDWLLLLREGLLYFIAYLLSSVFLLAAIAAPSQTTTLSLLSLLILLMRPLNGTEAHGWVNAQLMEAVEDVFEQNELMKYTYVAASTILFFEYCITLDREVRYAWCRQLTWPRAIFFLNRYISLLHSVFGMASAFLPVSFFRQVPCIFLTRLMETITAAVYVVWAAFSGLRVYAISRHNKIIASLVVLLALVPIIPNIAFDTLTELFIGPAHPFQFLVCFPLQRLRYYDIVSREYIEVLTRASLILSESIVIVVIVAQAWAGYRKQHQLMTLTALILREGALYFAARLLLDGTYLATAALPSLDIPFLIRTFLDLLPPILISRFFFHLDEWDRMKLVN
ncbi:hypothetical protein C8Q76DRAFT_799296 [Earliella scabrosa]|nr:hypothetical protein C8Q76DRAFT_799296 [Earliella scabrosa]